MKAPFLKHCLPSGGFALNHSLLALQFFVAFQAPGIQITDPQSLLNGTSGFFAVMAIAKTAVLGQLFNIFKSAFHSASG